MTIHASKGQQADYVIVLGLQAGNDGFPAAARETVLEEGLLPRQKIFLTRKSAGWPMLR